MPPPLCTLEEFLASLPEQSLGQAVTYAIGELDGASSRRVCGFSAPHYLARPWAISLGPPSRHAAVLPASAFSDSISDDQNEAVGLLQWGTGGFQNTMEIDWRQGGIYTVVGSAVQVAVRMPVAATQRLTLGASITPCSYQVPNNATRTVVSTGSFTFGSSEEFAIPAGARSVIAMQVRNNPVTSIPYSLRFFRSDSVLVVGDAEVNIATGDHTSYRDGVPIPIPFQAAYVTFTNRSGATSLPGVQLIFGLAF